jgi:hypothetical protein
MTQHENDCIPNIPITRYQMALIRRRPEGNNNMKRLTLICADGLISACSSTAALAQVDVVCVEQPPVVYEAPPAVAYEAPPPAVYAPASGYYEYGYRGERWWHDPRPASRLASSSRC